MTEAKRRPLTEAEWLACADPKVLLRKAQFRNSRRKSRLFAVACCRAVWPHFVDDRSRRAVEVAERHADGLATDEELQVAATEAGRAHQEIFAVLGKVGSSLEWAAQFVANANPFHAVNTVVWMVRWPRLHHSTPCTLERRTGLAAVLRGRWKVIPLSEPLPTGADKESECRLIRDIYRNPASPVTFAPAWRTPTVLALVRQMYESRDFSPMPILADALQDAGCDDPAILDHCRGSAVLPACGRPQARQEPHCRGCWLVDELLGKE